MDPPSDPAASVGAHADSEHSKGAVSPGARTAVVAPTAGKQLATTGQHPHPHPGFEGASRAGGGGEAGRTVPRGVPEAAGRRVETGPLLPRGQAAPRGRGPLLAARAGHTASARPAEGLSLGQAAADGAYVELDDGSASVRSGALDIESSSRSKQRWRRADSKGSLGPEFAPDLSYLDVGSGGGGTADDGCCSCCTVS